MKFAYFPHLIVDKETDQVVEEAFYPIVPIRLCYGHKLFPALVNCMVDSGSDRNLFPAEWGERVGIKIKKGKLVKIQGIGNIEMEAYRHKVKIYIGLVNFYVEADFCYTQKQPLLGRNGFFNCFKKIIFNEEERVTELEPRSNSKLLKNLN